MRRIPLLPLFCAVLLFLTSCAAMRQSTSALPYTNPKPPQHEYSSAPNTPRERAELHILIGTMAEEENQPETAVKQFLEALNEVPDSTVAERATAMALAAHKKNLVLLAAEKWVSIDPKVVSARKLIVHLAVSSGNVALATKQCQAIIDLKKTNGRGYKLVAALLGEERTYRETVTSVMDQLLAAAPDNPFAYQAGAILALQLKQGARARRLANHALTLDPRSLHSAMLLMAALIRQHQLKLADNVIKRLYRGHDKIELRLDHAQLLLEQGYLTEATRAVHLILKISPHNPQAYFILGVIDFTKGHLNDSKKRFLAAMATNGNQDGDVQYFLGRIEELKGHWKNAIAHFQKVTSPQAIDAKFREAYILGHLGHLTEAAAVLRQLDQEYPELSVRIIAAESSILLDTGHPEASLTLLNRALAAQPNVQVFLYMKALADERLGRIVTAERELEALLKNNPRSPRFLNALGYILAVHDTSQLMRARHLVAQALKIMPNSPAIIDSMGWILYRQGHPGQALPLLQKAYLRSRDPQIAAHLIAVMAALGDKSHARKLLVNALGRDPGNQALRKAAKELNPPVSR